MRQVLDGRSVAVGAFAGAALVAGLGAVQEGPDRLATPPLGRFQIAAAETNGSTVGYVVDTATGAVWTQTVAGNAFVLPKLAAADELVAPPAPPAGGR